MVFLSLLEKYFPKGGKEGMFGKVKWLATIIS